MSFSDVKLEWFSETDVLPTDRLVNLSTSTEAPNIRKEGRYKSNQTVKDVRRSDEFKLSTETRARSISDPLLTKTYSTNSTSSTANPDTLGGHWQCYKAMAVLQKENRLVLEERTALRQRISELEESVNKLTTDCRTRENHIQLLKWYAMENTVALRAEDSFLLEQLEDEKAFILQSVEEKLKSAEAVLIRRENDLKEERRALQQERQYLIENFGEYYRIVELNHREMAEQMILQEREILRAKMIEIEAGMEAGNAKLLQMIQSGYEA